MNELKTVGLGLSALAVVLGGCAAPGDAQPSKAASGKGQACFYARNISSWAPVDRSTVNLRVDVHDFYQLKLLGDCPNIDWAQRIGIEHQGSDWICSGLDATLIVAQEGVGPMRCPATSVRKLSPEEVAALPPKQKP